MKLALAGQLGAGCTEVASLIAEKTGCKVVNSETVIRRLVVEMGESFATFQEHIRSGEINLDRMLESFTLELANAEEKVIVEGRSAFFLLPRENYFKVLLVADREFRAKRISERRGISLQEAEREVERSDEERASLVRRFYGLNWLDSSLYHLTVNTRYKDMSSIAKLIIEAYNLLF